LKKQSLVCHNDQQRDLFIFGDGGYSMTHLFEVKTDIMDSDIEKGIGQLL